LTLVSTAVIIQSLSMRDGNRASGEADEMTSTTGSGYFTGWRYNVALGAWFPVTK